MVALIVCATLALAVAAVISLALSERRGAQRSYLNTAAFHFAEAGLELAGDAIVKNEAWISNGDALLRAEHAGEHQLRLAVTCSKDTSNAALPRFVVRSIARVLDAQGTVLTQRAVAATFTMAAGGGFAWPELALAARTSAKLNTSSSSGRITVASYNSASLPFPYLAPTEGQMHFSSGVGVAGTANGALEIFNARVWGTVQTGGGSVAYQADHPPIVSVDSALPAQFDASLITGDFDYTFPAIPNPADGVAGGWTTVSTYASQNSFANASGTITFGTNESSKTFVEINDQMILSPGKKIVINGTVVIAHKSWDLLQLNGSSALEIRPGGSLRIITNAKVQADQGFSGTWAPSQFELFTATTQEIVLKGTNTGRFYAPNAKLHLADGAVVLGQVVANTTDITNGSMALYDENMVAGGSSGALQLTDWHQIVPDAELRALFVE